MNVWVPTVLLITSALSSLALGAIVLLRQPHRATNRSLAAVCLNLVLWSSAVAMIIHAEDEESLRRWLAIAFGVAAFLPATFYNFIAHLPGQRFQGSRIIGVGTWVLAPVFVAGAFTPWHVTEIVMVPGALPHVAYGPVFGLFNLFLLVPFVAGAINLYRKQKQTSGLRRRQVRHGLFAIYAYALLSISTNVLAPLLGVGNVQAYGPAFATFMVGWFAYAIIRYHLLDISFIVSRTTVYLLTTAFTGGIFFLATSILFWSGAAASQPESRILVALLFGVVVAVVLQPLRDRVQLLTDRMVMQRRYDLQSLLARVSRHCADIVSLDGLIDTVRDDLATTIGANPVRVLLIGEGHDESAADYCGEETAKRIGSEFFDVLLEYATELQGPVILEQLLHHGPQQRERIVINQLNRLGAHVCVPLKSTTDVVGLLLLGPKASQDMYGQDDVVALQTMVGPLATAMENARLYRRLREANVLRAGILTSMRGGVVTVDSAGCVTLVNRTTVALFGPIMLGQHVSTLPKQLAELLLVVIKEKRDVRDFERVITEPDGSDVHVALSASCLTDGEGAITGAMVLLYDLTELKRLEENAERADRLSSLGTLAAGMAHEIKNPLASIRTFSQLLPRRREDDEFLATFSQIVPQEVDRINSIVTRLLDFARPRQTELLPTHVESVVKKVMALVESQAEKNGVRIDHDFGGQEHWIEGDEQQLVQVFLNLILNALAAVPDDGTGYVRVRAHTESIRLPRGGVPGPGAHECAVVVVSDNGPGIPPEVIDHVFTPFFTTKEEGTGLGLSVVHGIVSEHGGMIDCKNQSGGGAEVTVTLPLAVEAARLKRRAN